MRADEGLNERLSERLTVPLWWWLLAGFGLLILFVAFDISLGLAPALAVTALLALGTAAWLLAQGSTVVTGDGDGFRAGPARLPAWAIGHVESLDADETARARGPQADPHAFYVIKGFVRTSVRVTVADDSDPVPYWMVSTRHPDQLAAALVAAREAPRDER